MCNAMYLAALRNICLAHYKIEIARPSSPKIKTTYSYPRLLSTPRIYLVT